MPRILKSIAVVRDQDERKKDVWVDPMPFPTEARVIKSGHLSGRILPPPVSTDVYAMAPKQIYLDELNRLKAEIEQARTELRAVRAEQEAELEEYYRDEEEADPALADEEVYRARQQEINHMILTAEQQIADMTENAQAEARQMMEEARSQGYLEGFQKGYDEAITEFKKENDPKANLLGDLVDRLTQWEQQRLRDDEREMIQLVTAISSKVVAREIKIDPDTILSMLTDAVIKNHREEYIRINLSDELLPVDVKASAALINRLKELGANVTVRTIPGVPEGTIHLETPGGMIDMSVDTQLNNIQAMLNDQ